MNLFKLTYTWYEGEYEEIYLGKEVGQEEFEKDLKNARDFAESLIGKEVKEGGWLGKGYKVDCLPEYYETIIWFLINKRGYVECEIVDSEYSIDDLLNKKIRVYKTEEKINCIEL